jgi:competence protein ComEC
LINWKNIPFIRLILPLVAGILIGIYCRVHIDDWLFISLSSFSLLTLFYLFSQRRITRLKETLYGCILHSTILIFGITIVAFKTASNSTSHYSNFQEEQSKYVIQVLEVPKNKPNSIQVIGKIQRVLNDSISFPTDGSILLYFAKDSISKSILQGDILVLQSQLNEIAIAKNPGQFNYKEYLRFNQIYHQGFVSEQNWCLLESGGWSLTGLASSLRDKLLKTLKSNGLSGNELSVASALILGYKDDLDSDLKHSYSSAGATHVLAVSGLHVGIIFLVINSMLSFMDKNKSLKAIKLILILFLLWFYALITGLSPSVVRAATMFSFVAVGAIFNRKSSIYNTLAASAFVLLCYNPFLIMEVGFQLSYLAVLGIVYFQPKIYAKFYFKNWLLDKIWGITAVSIAAQLTTFPLGLLYFHQFPTYFMISNLFVIPGAFIIILVGITLFITSVFPLISALIAKLLFCLIFSMNWLVESIDKLPISLIEGISITILECWLLYITLLFFVGGLEFRKLKYFNFGIVCIIALFSLDLMEDKNLQMHQELCIYDIKNEPNINLLSNYKNDFFCSDSLYFDYSTMLFNVKHHWDDLDAISPTHSLLEDTQTFHLQNYDLTFIATEDSISEIVGSDIIYLESSYVPNIMDCKLVIIGSKVSYKSRKRIEKYASDHNILIHNIKKDGAFILNKGNLNEILN